LGGSLEDAMGIITPRIDVYGLPNRRQFLAGVVAGAALAAFPLLLPSQAEASTWADAPR
jgi:hypothetical protein